MPSAESSRVNGCNPQQTAKSDLSDAAVYSCIAIYGYDILILLMYSFRMYTSYVH